MARECVGCGEALPPGSRRGRRSRYHGPACRQRARRARLHTERGDAWDALERADAALIATRRAMTTGADPEPALHELLTAVVGLAHAHGVPAQPAEPPPKTPAVEPSVTKEVTKNVSDEPAGTAVDEESEPARARPPTLPKHVKRGEYIDPETVRLERAHDYELTRTWLVLATKRKTTLLVGFVRPCHKKWQPLHPTLSPVAGAPVFRTRRDALTRLLEAHTSTR